jgi:MFS family permease
MFGLFQGGIVPSYAIIVREYFPPGEAGARVGTVLMCTLLGMALGGWMTGVIFDLDRLLPHSVPERYRLERAQPDGGVFRCAAA